MPIFYRFDSENDVVSNFKTTVSSGIFSGGVGSLTGPIFGSIIFWVIISETTGIAQLIFENANGQQIAGVRFVLVGLLIMLLMIFRPSGLMGKKEELLLDVK